MATITFNQNRKSMLLWLHTENGCPTQCITGNTQRSAIRWLRDNGYIEFRSNQRGYYEWLVTPKGVEWLDANMPMVDQPQPADETTIEGEVSFYADGKAQDGTIVAGTDKYGYTVRSVNGMVYDEVKRGDIEPRLVDELDDFPFSDLGQDDEDTKPLPVMQRTPCNPNRPTIGDAIKLPLDKLIDAALKSIKPTERIDALNALRAYEWSTVPSWVMEIELSDLLQAFDSAMVERRKVKVKVLYGTEVTPEDVKSLIRTRSFCNLVSDCMTIVSQVYQARINHLVKVAHDS